MDFDRYSQGFWMDDEPSVIKRQTMFPQIRNDQLTLAHIPSPGACWERITEFALSYYCHTNDGSLGGEHDPRRPPLNSHLDALRAWLFAEQRCIRGGYMDDPDDDPVRLAAVRQVIEAIRLRVAGVDSAKIQTIGPQNSKNDSPVLPSELGKPIRKVLRMVTELHVRGFQRLRIVPGMSASGSHWRCAIAPVTNISNRHGAEILSWDRLVVNYSTGQERKYFGWEDAAYLTPSRLAALFIERFPRIAQAGRGADWVYAGWYQEMLNLTYPDSFPIAYADWKLPVECLATIGEKTDIRIPLPPPGWGSE